MVDLAFFSARGDMLRNVKICEKTKQVSGCVVWASREAQIGFWEGHCVVRGPVRGPGKAVGLEMQAIACDFNQNFES